jgi:hypothetical protein
MTREKIEEGKKNIEKNGKGNEDKIKRMNRRLQRRRGTGHSLCFGAWFHGRSTSL